MNNSKGCGGVMRIAPIPLYMACSQEHTMLEAIAEYAYSSYTCGLQS